ncbi:hypothetical protein HYH02_008338 [Chlamydomonas schloesseri]|uniref:DUF7906 domain-containing protein n=1 Tax=Chlamydomonas schloesseri TaxID=2026947 RepID=A0A835WG92_9CHLO|nr:hypothetical protein HYH02_008338 [Chlamydomonas schloesseri]|eukprot:KAG2446778.1 hypothetical protein HYH02_008338 [Chlamydomonas schloesseri]
MEELRKANIGRDVWAHVPKNKRAVWEAPDGRTINETLASFTDIPVDIVVHIKLIGFDGDGINHVKVEEAALARYLRGLHLDLQTAVLEPELKHLALRPRVHFRVSKAPVGLTHRVAGGLTSYIFGAMQGKRLSTVYVPHRVVDDVLATEEAGLAQSAGAHHDYTAAPSTEGGGSDPTHLPPLLTLYLLNLEPPASADYLYTYNEEDAVVAAGNWSDFKSCPGALHASEARAAGGGGLAWVDLAAAPHSYGPLRGGQGQVFPHSLPHATAFVPGAASTAILPELAALAAGAVSHLAWPALQHGDLALPNRDGGDDLEVAVIHIHDTLAVPPRSVDLDVLRQQLGGTVAGSIMGLSVKEHFLSFAVCDLCVNAYTNALRVRTQRQEGSNVVASAGQILDRLMLHTTLSEYSEIILAYAGVHQTHNVLPVFVFDLSLRDEPLLLDGALQASAFPDMVIAVASRAQPVRSRFSCGHMPRAVQPEDATRAVLGAVMQSAFGVSHTAQRYSPASGPGWNYLWALGATPFGPLSGITRLSIPAAAAVGRNLALAELERHTGRVAAVLRGLNKLSPPHKSSLKWAIERADLRSRVTARLAVVGVKLEMAVAALSAGRNAEALRLARHMSTDASALERTALQLDTALTQSLSCRGGTDWLVLVWPPAGSLVAVVAALWWRSRGARLKAEARYDKIY